MMGQVPPSPQGSACRLCLLFSHSFWFFKFLVLVGITVGSFYIPDGAFSSGEELRLLSSASPG